MTDNKENIGVLIEEFHESPEYGLYKSLQNFSSSLYIFNKNYEQLEKIIDLLVNNPASEHFLDIRNRDQLNTLLAEVIRLLHNFVAAAMSLVDHTRNMYRELYSDKGNFSDYQDKIDNEFIIDPLVQFVHCLRQYCQHYRAPDISIQCSWTKDDGGLKKTINLLKKDLKQFKSWNAKAQGYLDLIEEQVDLYQVIAIYRKKVLSFHVWFNSRQREIHKKEFEVLRKKEEKLLIAQLNHFLTMALSRGEKSRDGEIDIFYGIFNSREYKELSAMSMDSPKRCERALKLVQKYLTVPDDARKLINDWYEIQRKK